MQTYCRFYLPSLIALTFFLISACATRPPEFDTLLSRKVPPAQVNEICEYLVSLKKITEDKQSRVHPRLWCNDDALGQPIESPLRRDKFAVGLSEVQSFRAELARQFIATAMTGTMNRHHRDCIDGRDVDKGNTTRRAIACCEGCLL